MYRLIPVLVLLALSACTAADFPAPNPTPPAQTKPVQTQPEPTKAEIQQRASTAARNFITVVETVEPVAEAECRRLAPRANCDFNIVVDDRPNQAPNAFQTIDRQGRPILAFNLALIASVRNKDEMAFVMGHEAAHHILGHLQRTQQNAAVGAVIFSGLAAMSGASASSVRSAEEFGAAIGARSYSKDFELEADSLGTRITARAGYDPIRGAEFFTRLPDPGNKFLGTHPPNKDRINTVRKAASAL
ncbi:MAG: M48 family metallopeptidase [Thalassococcus sp.]|uniref:M48 family metallopeptidase n=1 Tax=Thalassococcus sp. TaxID=1928858 RepID=UPI001B048161|nr:M48 family metallopeptidase [Thalassococcus sp.]MBO6867649.1 M48 family metallopeptidase [Thalassococcus sp.]